MSAGDIDTETLRRRLVEQRDSLLEVADSSKEAAGTVELDQTRVGRVSRMDALQAQAMAQESNRRREISLQRIERALKRIDEGDYGYCTICGEPISGQRLEVDPGALLCIGCASDAEKNG